MIYIIFNYFKNNLRFNINIFNIYYFLNTNSKVLLFSTEGDTDPQRWKNIVWEAKDR